jgi:hypothetical protein
MEMSAGVIGTQVQHGLAVSECTLVVAENRVAKSEMVVGRDRVWADLAGIPEVRNCVIGTTTSELHETQSGVRRATLRIEPQSSFGISNRVLELPLVRKGNGQESKGARMLDGFKDAATQSGGIRRTTGPQHDLNLIQSVIN